MIRDHFIIADSILFTDWNQRKVIENEALLNSVLLQTSKVGSNCNRILSWGWPGKRKPERNIKLMVMSHLGKKINPEYAPSLRRYCRASLKHNQAVIIDLFCQNYAGFRNFMPFPDLFSDDPENVRRRAEWIETILDATKDFKRIIYSVGNELHLNLEANLKLHQQAIDIMLARGIPFERMMLGINFDYFEKPGMMDEQEQLKKKVDALYSPKYGSINSKIKRTVHGCGLMDSQLTNACLFFGGSSVKLYFSNDGLFNGHSAVDVHVDKKTGKEYRKNDYCETKECVEYIFKHKRNPATGLWGWENIHEGCYLQNGLIDIEKLKDLTGIIASTQAVSDVYRSFYGADPVNVERFKNA
jgi:hypothetical protein